MIDNYCGISAINTRRQKLPVFDNPIIIIWRQSQMAVMLVRNNAMVLAKSTLTLTFRGFMIQACVRSREDGIYNDWRPLYSRFPVCQYIDRLVPCTSQHYSTRHTYKRRQLCVWQTRRRLKSRWVSVMFKSSNFHYKRLPPGDQLNTIHATSSYSVYARNYWLDLKYIMP